MINVSISHFGRTGCFCSRTSEYRNNVSIDWGNSNNEIIKQRMFMKGKKLEIEIETLTPGRWGYIFYRNILEVNQE